MSAFSSDLVLRRFFFRWERALRAVLPESPWHVLGALSGGCDSVVLARLLLESAGHGPDRLTLAHVHHGLRPGADADEAFVRKLAGEWQVPLRVERVDARGLAEERGWSIEQAARALRLLALERMARASGAGAIALGHQMDDQAETVLLRLVRGAGPRGLGGMRASRPLRGISDSPRLRLVRPLLGFRREEIRALATRAGLSWAEDPTNLDPTRLRNRIRHDLIPHLQQVYNPRLVESLADAAGWQQRETELVVRAANRVLRRVRRSATARMVELDAAGLIGEPEAVVTRVLWRAYQSLAGRHAALGRRHARALLSALRTAAGGESACVHLPGRVRACFTRERIRFEPHEPRPKRQQTP
jgi:tRNA(Ile)-lysidine synthase